MRKILNLHVSLGWRFKRLNRKVFTKSNITGRKKNGPLGDVF